MKEKRFTKGVAVCLVLAMVLGYVPEANFSLAETENPTAGTESPSTVSGGAVSGGAVSGGAVSGGALETPTATPTETPTAAPTATPIDDLSAYKLAATTLTARGGASRVRLNWTKVTGAEGYYIYARTASESAYKLLTTIKEGATAEYTKTSLVNGTTYYYRIAAYRTVNGVVVEGDLSTAVSATPASVSATSKAAKKYSTKAKFISSPAYKTYKKTKAAMNYSKSFAIPGMKNTNAGGFACTSMVPQGICLAGSYFLISAYDYKGTDYSVIYVVSRAAKSYITTIVLPSKAKVGGLAYDGTNVWVSKGKAVASFPYTVITDAVNSGKKFTSLSSYQSVCALDSTASFMGYYNDVLWVGTFKASASSTMKGYTLNNKETSPSLSPAYTMSVPSRTQGITFDNDGTMVLTRSYRTKKAKENYISQVRTYRPSFASAGSSGKVLKNTALKVMKLPPMAEGVAIYGTYTYALFSSSYYKTCKYPVDRVLALKTNKLVV